MKGAPVDDAMTVLDTNVVEMVGIHVHNAIPCLTKIESQKLIK